jgi:CubicO group peptidase (beta-lactamase class C family)
MPVLRGARATSWQFQDVNMQVRDLILLITLVAATTSRAAPTTAPVFPGQSWETREPADVGLSKDALVKFSKTLGGRGVVVRHGVLVYSWGDIEKPGDVASAAKPVYAHFLFKAIEEKKIASLDEAVVKYEPQLGELNALLDHKDRQITWRHLATQTSCYGVAEPPGKAYDYSDWQMALFWDLLFTKLYGATPENVDEKVLTPLLAREIGCQDKPSFLAFGVKDRSGRLSISPRDFARFGLLYLRSGRWNDKQLLEEQLVAAAVGTPISNDIPRTAAVKAEMLPNQRSIGGKNNQTDHLGSYSYLWWLNGIGRDEKRNWPDAPRDLFAALGHGGKRACVVIPSLDLVASWNDGKISGRADENEVLKLLAATVVTK